MNPLQKLAAWARANRGPALAAAAAGVGGLAVVMRRRGATGGGPAGSGSAGVGYPQAVTGGGGASYDSTPFDVYDQVQSQLDSSYSSLRGQLDYLEDTVGSYSGLGARLEALEGREAPPPTPVQVNVSVPRVPSAGKQAGARATKRPAPARRPKDAPRPARKKSAPHPEQRRPDPPKKALPRKQQPKKRKK